MRVRLVTYAWFLCFTCLLLVIVQYHFGPVTSTDDIKRGWSPGVADKGSLPPSSATPSHSFIARSHILSSTHIIEDVSLQAPAHPANCRMDNCFNFTKCKDGFRVYIHSTPTGLVPSVLYQQIIDVIKLSSFYTTDISAACVYVSGIDTLDRDKLSTDYVQNLQEQLSSLPHWNNGRNHVIFNLYSGTWPDYSEHFGIDIGYAILAKASISTHKFRAGFDISLPLFHKTLPKRGGEEGKLYNVNVPSNRKYLLSFKGKRYLTGIGSVSRNALYHIHNGHDIILLTTCKHGKDWERYADERCAEDNALYDKYDFTDLLANSTFCLVPRGRRLGSFRFLEVLQYGCIPVLLSDNWELPFSEIIDWQQAAIWGDESLLYQLPYSLRSMPFSKISSLQQQSQLLWTKYFASLESIVTTTLHIIKERVEAHNSLSLSAWNTYPGVYAFSPSYSRDLTLFPFFSRTNATSRFTALVYITEHSRGLKKFLSNLSTASHLHTIYLFVVGKEDLLGYINSISHSIRSIPTRVKLISNIAQSYTLYKEFPTDAVLTIYQRDQLITEEVDFAFSVWKEYPSRLVGHLSRSYLWHNGEQKYHYTSKLSHQYSIILLDTSIIHKYYLYKLSSYIDRWGEHVDHCSDILLNFITSDTGSLPPIKVGQRLLFNKSSGRQLDVHNSCLDIVYEKFGYVPLQMSHVRLDPALFKDNVARTRKRYVNMERV